MKNNFESCISSHNLCGIGGCLEICLIIMNHKIMNIIQFYSKVSRIHDTCLFHWTIWHFSYYYFIYGLINDGWTHLTKSLINNYYLLFQIERKIKLVMLHTWHWLLVQSPWRKPSRKPSIYLIVNLKLVNRRLWSTAWK